MPLRKDLKSILIIGSGPIIIGQACEFDYSGSQALRSLKEDGITTILINSNPATIMTDPVMADHIYLKPLTTNSIKEILSKHEIDAVLPTMGGQTALNLCIEADEKGIWKEFDVEIIGVDIDAINITEDREKFRILMDEIGVGMAPQATATSYLQGKEIAQEFGFPLVIRASYTLGGAGASIVYKEEDFDDPFADEGDSAEINFWFNSNMLDRVEKIHDYLESLPEVGKVQSISTLVKVFTQLDKGRKPDDYDLALIRKLMPENVKDSLVNPYLSQDANQIHINMRLIESDPNLRRSDLIEKIRKYLVEELKFDPETIQFTGMVVLYNNMLQSLYRSQILTIGVVVFAIMVMFMILFRSFSLALLGIIPNLLAAGTVLSLMGWLGIPLDMMTITIAAITVGIAVDNTIHYIHRFQKEFKVDQNYLKTMDRCHGSIGKAMYYTSVTITLGFSILALSEFMPTIYFGLLTGAAMVIALLGALALLPILIVVFQPLASREN